ncbi:hypothetical protein OC834_003284 [Tilletia horrida]|nr:hypothetical protein OC834_003284 [Tilletia horrida]
MDDLSVGSLGGQPGYEITSYSGPSTSTGNAVPLEPVYNTGHGEDGNDGDEEEEEDDDEDENDDENDDEIVIVGNQAEGMDVDNDAAATGAAASAADGAAIASATVALAPPKKKDFDDLPQELVIQILLKLDSGELVKAMTTSRRIYEITKNASFRVTYFTRCFDRTEVLYAALQRPKMVTPEMLQKLLDNGAHFSRYLAQMVIKSFNAERHNRHSLLCRMFPSNMPFTVFSLIVAEAAKRYGNEMALSRGSSDDAEQLTALLSHFRRSKSDADWKPIQRLFEDFHFMFYTRSDSNRMDFVHQIALEPRLAPLATQNGLIVSEADCTTIISNVFSDLTKDAQGKARSLTTFIESGLPGLHVSKEMAIKAILHQTGDATNRLVMDDAHSRSSSYRAIKILSDAGKLAFNLSRAIAETLIKKRFSRSCLPKLPYLNFILEDFPEVVPLLPRKTALIKFLTHTDYSTEAGRQKLHDSLSIVRPHLTQRLLVDLMAHEFMATAVPLQYARDFLSDIEVDTEVAAFEALRKCMWHPCKGASVLALYEFVEDKESFKQVMLDELRRWRFDLNDIQPDNPDATNDLEYHKTRTVSLLAWDYVHVQMWGDQQMVDSYLDTYDLRKVGKFTDFPGELADDSTAATLSVKGSTSQKQDGKGAESGADAAMHGAEGSNGVARNDDDAGASAETSQPQASATVASIEAELKEEPLPDKNPHLAANLWAEDNLLYGTLAHMSYNRTLSFSQPYSPLAVPLADTVLDLFGPHSEAADIMYSHALLNGNESVLELYHSRFFYPSLMHLRLLMHVGRRFTPAFTTRIEQSPFRKRGFGTNEDDIRGRTVLKSPFWCSTDTEPLKAQPGAAEDTVDLETGDDYFGQGLNESDDDQVITWRRPTRHSAAGRKIKEESGSASGKKVGKQKADSNYVQASAGKRRTPRSPSKAAATAVAAEGSVANGEGDAHGADVTPATEAEESRADASMADVSSGTATVVGDVTINVSADASASVDPDASATALGLNAAGRPKRRAAADVSYFDDEALSEDFVDPEETKAHIREVQELSGIGPIKRKPGRPRKNAVPMTVVPVSPSKAKRGRGGAKGAAGGGRGKKRKADETAEGEKEADVAAEGEANDGSASAAAGADAAAHASGAAAAAPPGRGRPKGTQSKGATAAAAAAKKRIDDYTLVAPPDDGLKPIIPLPVFSGPMPLSSVRVLDIWAATVEFPVMWKWATYERHIRAAQAVEAWHRHVSILLWHETRKHKTRKEKVKTDAQGQALPPHRLRVSKTEAYKSLEELEKTLESLAAQYIRELEMQRSQFLATVKDADAEVDKVGRQRRALVNRVRTQRAQAAAQAAAALLPPAPAPAPAEGEGDGNDASMDVDADVNGEGEDETVAGSGRAVDEAEVEASSPAKGKGKGRVKGKGTGKGKEKAAAPSKGKGKGKAVAPLLPAPPTSSKGKGKAKAVDVPAAVSSKGPSSGDANRAGDWDDDDDGDDDAGFESDGSANSLDSAVDASGKAKRKETGKTADEMLREPNKARAGNRYHPGGGLYGTGGGTASLIGATTASLQQAAAMAAMAAATGSLLYDDEEESYGYVYSDEDDSEIYDSEMYDDYDYY